MTWPPGSTTQLTNQCRGETTQQGGRPRETFSHRARQDQPEDHHEVSYDNE